MRHAKDEQFTQNIQLKSNTRITKERVGQELELKKFKKAGRNLWHTIQTDSRSSDDITIGVYETVV